MHVRISFAAMAIAALAAVGCGSSSNSSGSGSSSTGASTSGTGGSTGSCVAIGFSCNADSDCCDASPGSCAFNHCEHVSTTGGTGTSGSSGSTGSDVVINEISVKPDPWMELHNRGTSDVSLNGWMWSMTGHNPANPTFNVTDSYTFGNVSIPAGGYLVFHAGTGTDDASNVYRGSDIMWGEDPSSSQALAGSAKMMDASGHDVDFVCWVSLPTGSTSTDIWSSTQAVPGFDTGFSISRGSGADTNSPADWSQTAKTEGAANP